MKLVRARVRNFKCIDDVEVGFAPEGDRNVTLVRADLGKTAMLEAWAWCLGRISLRPTMRPAGAVKGDGRTVVEVEFDLSLPGDSARRYRMVQAGVWRTDGSGWRAEASARQLADVDRGLARVNESQQVAVEEELRRRVMFLDDTGVVGFLRNTGGDAVAGALAGRTSDAVRRISERMNKLFLRMVGQRESGMESIVRAQITSDHGLAVSLRGTVRDMDTLPSGLRIAL